MLNNMINESYLNEDVAPIFSGEEIADMVGMGDLYRQGKQEIAQDMQMRESFKNKFANLTERIEKAPKGMEKDFD